MGDTQMSDAPMLNTDARTGGTNLDEKVRMKKQLGLLEGVAIILGIIFGSGIFISPKGVIKEVGSVGLSLVVWVACGLLSMIGALCYAELGTSIPKSGGDYAYIFEAFGALPAFLYLWDAMLIFVPTTNAIMGLTFANYVIQPFFPNCPNPDSAVRLIAAVTICFLTFMNCYDVRQTTKMQNVFMFTKILALVLIIIAGFSYLFLGNTSNFDRPFEGGSSDPGKIAVAIYSGIFSYSGWNYLNFMTEELKDPYVNLPRAIYISLPLVTLIYVLANVAYLAVLTPVAMLASNAIAVTFADDLLGVFSWVMPLLVALSAFGGLSVHIMTSSRSGNAWVGLGAVLRHVHAHVSRAASSGRVCPQDVLRGSPVRPLPGHAVAHQHAALHAHAFAGVPERAVPGDAVHQRRARAHHVLQLRGVLLHHAVRDGHPVAAVQAPAHDAPHPGVAVDTRGVRGGVCLPGVCAVLLRAVRGGHGRAHHSERRARLLPGRAVGRQARVVRERAGQDHAHRPEAVPVGQGGDGRRLRSTAGPCLLCSKCSLPI
ncbi:Y+L amino acid transporter 2 isoform X1 [Bacillus rossius redtenbacheri]|uniref:Y+L amino acid transporter 2 isoform X1 n=1 Tax=Bacillus rossius redtenbacheri TaxID=93214 RepID=UPI002FDCCB7A